jgi:hypothetical protein
MLVSIIEVPFLLKENVPTVGPALSSSLFGSNILMACSIQMSPFATVNCYVTRTFFQIQTKGFMMLMIGQFAAGTDGIKSKLLLQSIPRSLTRILLSKGAKVSPYQNAWRSNNFDRKLAKADSMLVQKK